MPAKRRTLDRLALKLGGKSNERSALLARLNANPEIPKPSEAGARRSTPDTLGIRTLPITRPKLARPRRPDGDGTPKSSAQRPRKLLRDCYPELARQVHPTKNLPLALDDIGIGTERRIWWRCPAVPSHEWDARIASRIKLPSCPICTGRLLTPETSLLALFPGIAKEWHPTRNDAIDPAEVRPASLERRWWLCSRNPAHEWQATVFSRARSSTGCPICVGGFVSPEVPSAGEAARRRRRIGSSFLRP